MVKLYVVGDKVKNNLGLEAEIVKLYKGTKTINKEADLLFVDGTVIRVRTPKIATGSWKNPNNPAVCGVGYIGIGQYNSQHKGKDSRAYSRWSSMLSRCYSENDPEYHNYGGRGVSVCEEWHNFQKFAKWFHEHDRLGCTNLSLDKDIRFPECFSGLEYSPKYCCLVDSKINTSMASIGNLGIVSKPDTNTWGIYQQATLVYGSEDKTIINYMLYEVRLQKLMMIGRSLERNTLPKEVLEDFNKKLIWYLKLCNSKRQELINYLSSKTNETL